MRKTFLNVLMMIALVAGVSSTLVSCKDYDDDIATLQKQYGEQSTLLEAVEAKLAAAQNSIAGLTSSQATLAAALETAKAECAKNLQAAKDYADEGDVATLTAANAAINVAVANLEAAIQKAVAGLESGKIADLVAADAALETKIVAAQASADQAINLVNDLIGKVASIETDLGNVKAGLTKVQGDLADVMAKLGALDARMTAAEAEIAKLQTALELQGQTLASLTGEPIQGPAISEVLANIEALKAQVATQDAALQAALDAQSATVAAELASIDAKVADLAASIGVNTDGSVLAGIKETVSGIIDAELPKLAASITDVDAKYEVITKALSNKLRALVLKPMLYIDGIETIEYPYVTDTVLRKISCLPYTRQRADETYAKEIADLTDYVLTSPIQVVQYNPVIGVDYHLNPATADVKHANVVGFIGHVVENETRFADHSQLGITSPEKYYDGCNAFKVAKGMVTVGLQVANPGKLNHLLDTQGNSNSSSVSGNGNPAEYEKDGSVESGTGHYSYGKDNVIALQIGSQAAGKDTVVTSDYAMILAERMWVEGIIWNKNLAHKTTKNDETKGHNGSEEIENHCKRVHVWDTPQEALADQAKEAVQLYYDSEKGINLEDYLGVHYVRESGKLASNKNVGTWAFTSDEMKHFGLTYKFELIDYKIAGNKTGDSRYISLDGKALSPAEGSGLAALSESNRGDHGLIFARDVDAKGSTVSTVTKASVDREPLVRVLLFLDGKIIKDGYILIHITEDIIDPSEPVVPKTAKTIDFASGNITFDLCNGMDAYRTQWAQFSSLVLSNGLTAEGLEKDFFDKYYAPDVLGDHAHRTFDFQPTTDECEYLADHIKKQYKDDMTGYSGEFYAAHYSNTPASANATKSKYGTVIYYENGSETAGAEDNDNHYIGVDGQENHTWSISFSAEDLEMLTHDGKADAKYETYVRYIKRSNVGAPQELPDYLYLKLTTNISRKQVPVEELKEKNINYWYAANGDDHGLEYVLLNVDNPLNGKYTYIWSRPLLAKFVGNKITTKYDRKFYFTPNDTEIKGQDGVTYTITAKGNGADYNKLICKYNNIKTEYDGINTLADIDQNSDPVSCTPTSHIYGTEEENNKVINNCVIDYDKGTFANDKLYAYANNKYYLIATINQQTGELTLNHPTSRWNAATLTVDQQITETVINAIGYAEKNANTDKQLHKEIAVAYKTGCNYAIQTKDARFFASWERPINLEPIAKQMVIDAKTNANKIYLADILKVYDYRGPAIAGNDDPVLGWRGDMNMPATKWLWAYYDIHEIDVQCTPSSVQTTMHVGVEGKEIKWTTLDKIDPYYLRLWANENGDLWHGYKFDLSNFYGVNYNHANKSQELYDIMTDPAGTHVVTVNGKEVDLKEEFGYIYYDNEGNNVTDFKVRVPIAVHYEWGVFYTTVEIDVIRTVGH